MQPVGRDARWGWAVGVAWAAGCAGEAPPAVGRAAAPVAYGADDRVEVYEHPNPAMRERVRRSVAALVPPGFLVDRGGPALSVNAYTLGEAYRLCTDQRFREQPSIAACSGTLIAPDLFLTAGHCMERLPCATTQVVFGYYYDGPGALHPITRADVFACREVVVMRNDGPDARPRHDYAVLRLDRAATPRFEVAPMRAATGPVDVGAPLGVVGFGSGIPAKIDTGGRVRSARAQPTLDYFTANTDTFGGHSGSGVFDPTTTDLVGILLRGETDYVDRGGCQAVNQCAEDACSGEDIGYGSAVRSALCAAAPGSAPCAVLPPDAGVTPVDAGTPPRCGDGRCDAGESTATCPGDCPRIPPAEWRCGAARFGAGNECDCNCGASDPDCDDPARTVFNCGAGEACDARGQCFVRDAAVSPVDAGSPVDVGIDAPTELDVGVDAAPVVDAGDDRAEPSDVTADDAEVTADDAEVTADDAGASDDTAIDKGPVEEGGSTDGARAGCGCGVAARGAPATAWGASMALALAAVRRRRRGGGPRP